MTTNIYRTTKKKIHSMKCNENIDINKFYTDKSENDE